jgi:hypothetical protein
VVELNAVLTKCATKRGRAHFPFAFSPSSTRRRLTSGIGDHNSEAQGCVQTSGRDRDQTETALLPAPFWCTYAWNRPTSTGARGGDPLWLCWRGKPWLAIRWRGYAASKWSQLERQ